MNNTTTFRLRPADLVGRSGNPLGGFLRCDFPVLFPENSACHAGCSRGVSAVADTKFEGEES